MVSSDYHGDFDHKNTRIITKNFTSLNLRTRFNVHEQNSRVRTSSLS